MRTLKALAGSGLSLLSLSVCLSVAQAEPLVLSLDDLAYSKQQVDARKVPYQDAYQKLLERAESTLKHPYYSVMDKALTAASGDKHDYYSFPPYWWPDPAKPDGLPYIRKDGQTNPDANSDATDKQRLVKMSKDVWTLALAWYFSQDARYADKAAQQLKTWFLNADTRMNPSLAYAQAIPGINTGRGIGIIDSRALVDVVDAIELLRPSGKINDAEYQELRRWFGDFYHWMTTSQNGFEEDNWHNNHGTWFDLQAASFALFSGKPEEAKKRLQITQLRRIAGQFDAEGRQTGELERTRPWHYSNFNLDAYSQLGRLGEKAGVDIWNFTLDGHSLRNGYRYIAGYINTDTPWPWKDIDNAPEARKALINVTAAARAWPEDALFQEKAQWLHQRYPDDITTLVLPLKAAQ